MRNYKKRLLAFAGFALLLGPGLVRADMGALEPGTNRQGEDFRGYAFRVISAEDCRVACDSIDTCKAMTFVRSDSGGDCWLKHSVPPTSAQPGMTSAMKKRHWKGEGGD